MRRLTRSESILTMLAFHPGHRRPITKYMLALASRGIKLMNAARGDSTFLRIAGCIRVHSGLAACSRRSVSEVMLA